ncbi:MAG: helix-turn-helix transcriptional regulator [Acidobacteriota bacterium]
MTSKQLWISALQPLPFAAHVGSLLAQRRRDRRWTQSLLAQRVRTSPMRISRIENGHVPPTLQEALRLAEAFGTTLDDLLMGTTAERETPVPSPLQPIRQVMTEEEFRVFSGFLDALAVGLQIRREGPR